MPKRRYETLLAVILLYGVASHAGGPRYIAGTTYFNSGLKGTPVTWAAGAISYYTDKGDLSPLLPETTADQFVATAFSNWTAISTAAVSATRAGQLAEDVTGALITSGGLPTDVLPTATGQPVAIVYDDDGSVTEALLGQGASASTLCSTNSVFEGIDAIGADAHFQHALIVLNGLCAQSARQLPDLKYHLIRMLGQIFGLDWSQANVNVLTLNPPPTSADLTGFPVMHAVDPPGCPECYGATVDPTAPKVDGQAALSRLYPVTASNQSDFPGKQLSASQTARIFGSVFFVDATGAPAQPMQGVNVVARWVDPQTNLVSSSAVAASVSGFLFRGNAGNPITGVTDPSGDAYSNFGSADPTYEGFFDLSGLPVPAEITNAEFQLSIEPVDPVWSIGLQPYGDLQVQPSGSTNRMFVYVLVGGQFQRNILMSGGAIYSANWFGPTSFSLPAAAPTAGDWTGALSLYNETDYFPFTAQANRTASVSVTALDDSSQPSAGKAQPVIGAWPSTASGTAASGIATLALNTTSLGETRLDFPLNGGYTIGIADFRGDGRPDYRYHARLFYGDTAAPGRVSVAGGTLLTIRGLGFSVR